MANESNNNQSELKAFFVQHGTKIAVAFVVIFALIAGIVQYKEARKVAAAEQSELIGVGLTYLYANEKDSALVEFENKIASGKLEGLALAKALLLPRLLSSLLISSTKRRTSMVLPSFSRTLLITLVL